MLPPQNIPEWSNTYWVGGERPALPQSSHCWLNTTELDLLQQSPGQKASKRRFKNDTVAFKLKTQIEGMSRVNIRSVEGCSGPVSNTVKNTHHMWGWLGFIGKIPVAVKDLSQDWVVRFLGHRTFPSCMESWKVPLHHLNHALPRLRLVCNTKDGSRDGLISRFFWVGIWISDCGRDEITSQIGQDVQRNLHTFLTKTFFLGWRWAEQPVRHNEGARMKICT